MKLKSFKAIAKSANPYIIAVLVIVVGIQTWLLAGLYQKNNSINPCVEQSKDSDHPKELSSLDPIPLWRSDPSRDDLFPSPWGLNTWDPLSHMQSLQDRMNGLFDDAFDPFSLNPGFDAMLSDDALSPQIDILEEDDRIVVKIELPGVDNSNLSISCEGQQLNISGTLEQLREHKDSTGLLQSRQKSSRFSRSIPLPHVVVAEKMETTTHKNQVIVTIPRA